jgi:hypothetical protein
LEPFLQQVLLSSPVFSQEEREGLVDDFRELREKFVDGWGRESQLMESITLEKSDFKMTDIQLETRLEGLRSDVLNFVSLGLSTIERLYLTNHLSEELYNRYKNVLRYIPQFHEEMIKRLNRGRGNRGWGR